MDAEQKVTPLELFFDLVFVFAITQVTAMMADDPTWAGVGRGMLVLAAIWWAWVGYAWLTNFLATDEGVIRAVVLVAMAAMLIVAIALPQAFGSDAGLFAGAFLLVRAVHLGVYYRSAAGDEEMRASLRQVGWTWLLSPIIILVAAFVDGDTVYLMWACALLVDFAGPLFANTEGWKLHAGHFAERHGLIMIIAIGESLVAIGVGASAKDLTAGVIVSVALGVAIAGALWWAYFDVVAIAAERKLHSRPPGRSRNAQARDAYSYLHLPMIAGVVLFALGCKKTVSGFDEHLELVPAVALSGGLALYFLAHIAFRWRNTRTLSRQRTVTVVALLATIPVVTEVDAIVALALVAVLVCALVAYEATRFREARDLLRHPERATA